MIYKFGLIGEKLGHSLSPELHRELMARNNIQGTYELIEIPPQTFEARFLALKQSGYNGINVTIPYKQRVIPLLDELSPQADYIGAVNTIAFSKGRATGFNTDYDGFLKLLSDNAIRITNARAAVLGTGGAARAVIKALLDSGIGSMVIVSTKAAAGLEGVETLSYSDFERLPDRYDFLVNCTPVGMHPDQDKSPLPASAIRADAVVDLIYNPAETMLMREAAAAGAKTVNGLGMLWAQAQKAEEIWIAASKAAD